MQKITLILAVLMMFVGGVAEGATYVCDVLGAYDVAKGKIIKSKNASSFISTWPKLVFDDDSGLFKYGREGHWKEERLTVTNKGSKGFSASAHYQHNGTIFNALTIYSWRKPIEFQWMNGGLSDVLTGTCKHYGSLR